MINVLVWGIGGRMGQAVCGVLAETKGARVALGVDGFADPAKFDVPVFKSAKDISMRADVIIDFSRAEAIFDIIPYAVENKIPCVLCTTGYNEEEENLIKNASKQIAVFKSGNMSLGINLLINLAKKASDVLGRKFDIEIVETHHNVKADSPSGTALMIANAINEQFDGEKEYIYGRAGRETRRAEKEIGIHAVRGGTVVGKHDVMFLGNDETITLSHQATSKAVFAEGAVAACQFLIGKPCGIYDMQDMLGD